MFEDIALPIASKTYLAHLVQLAVSGDSLRTEIACRLLDIDSNYRQQKYRRTVPFGKSTFQQDDRAQLFSDVYEVFASQLCIERALTPHDILTLIPGLVALAAYRAGWPLNAGKQPVHVPDVFESDEAALRCWAELLGDSIRPAIRRWQAKALRMNLDQKAGAAQDTKPPATSPAENSDKRNARRGDDTPTRQRFTALLQEAARILGRRVCQQDIVELVGRRDRKDFQLFLAEKRCHGSQQYERIFHEGAEALVAKLRSRSAAD